MFSKNIPVFLVLIGLNAFASAEPPCDGVVLGDGLDCEAHKGLYFFDGLVCVENKFFDVGFTKGVACINPGYEFNTREDCKKACKPN